jgi:hypothetical protein
MLSYLRTLPVLVFYSCISASTALACDFCSLSTSLQQRMPRSGSTHFSVSEQFTDYGKLQQDGSKVPNEEHQRMAASQTTFAVAHDFTDRFSAQINIPYLNRRFSRLHDGERQQGTEAGIGDLSILALYSPYRFSDGDNNVVVQLFGGIKLPTGDADRLQEEQEEHEEVAEEEHEEHLHALRHAGEDHDLSAVHGHDLALGSGSFDFPFGAAVFAQSGRFFVDGLAQYILRTEGDHDYEYADDLQWNVGPAYYILLEHELTLALKLRLSGEYKGKDTGPDGSKAGDTSMNQMFVGPELLLNSGAVSAFVGYDAPVRSENSGVQTVANYRIRAGLNVRF